MALLVMTVSLACSVQAQEKNPDLQRELTLEKEYTPDLRDAGKLNRLPEIKEPEAPKMQVDLSNYTLEYPLSPYFQPLGVINYFPQFADSEQRGYLTAGLGTPINFDWDAGYHILQSASDRVSIFGSERITNSHVNYLQNKEKGDMKINDLVLGLNVMHRYEKATLSADLKYDRSAFNYYGFPLTGTATPSAENHINNRLGLRVGVASAADQRLRYRLNALYTSYRQGNVGAENRLVLDGGLYAPINALIGIGVDVAAKNYAYKGDDYRLFTLNPYLTVEGDTWDGRLGVKGNLQSGGRRNGLHPSLDVRFRWRPDDAVLLYLTADGGIQDNSRYNIFCENRYLNPTYRIYDSKSPLDGTFGVVFSPVANLSVDLFTGYKWVKDEHFYYTQSYASPLLEIQTEILPQYADANVFKLGGTAKYQYQDKFDIIFKILYNRWNVTEMIDPHPFSTKEVWNKPVFTGDLAAGYKLPIMPLRIDLNYHLETGRKTLWYDPSHNPLSSQMIGFEILPMKNIHDLNATATYTFTKSFSAFAKVNNLLFQKYDLWYGYPAQGFNLMVGASFKF
jgi:hypothetical protein